MNSETGLLGLLTIVFIALKLTNVAPFPWWLALLPAYGMFLMFPVVIALGFIVVFGIKVLKK